MDRGTETATSSVDDNIPSSENPNSDKIKQVFSTLVHLFKDQGLSPQQLMNMYQRTDQPIDKSVVPVSVFATSLSPSESLCKYLKEVHDLTYKEISLIINRDERSVWTSYRRSQEKGAALFTSLATDILIPVRIFADRRLSILEHVVLYLKEKTGVTSYKIAKMLNKTPSVIYTIHKRAIAKRQNDKPRPSAGSVPDPTYRPSRQMVKRPVKKKRRKRGILR
ncbi:MAG: hypothetical protein ACE5DM_05390 [Candidatus Nanoarchaeia archaeon]